MKTCSMIQLVTLLFLVFSFIVPVYAVDPPDLEWQTVLGGIDFDFARGVNQTSDGGYIVVGTTSSIGGYTANNGDIDVMVVKLDPSGNPQWQKAFGADEYDGGASIQQTTDGGYILVGFTTVSRYRGTYAPYTTATTYSTGYIEYDTVYPTYSTTNYWSGQNGKYTIRAESRYVTPKDTYTGYTSMSRDRQVWVIKLDPNGNLQWQKVLGGYGEDEGFDIQQTADGGYILTGYSNSSDSGDVGTNHGDTDFWVVKLSSSGNLQWQRLLGGYAGDIGTSIRQTTDGGYILTGWTESDNSGNVGANHGELDVWVIKIDSSGNLQWQKVLGGSGADHGYCIRATADGGYVLIGSVSSSNSGDVSASHGSSDTWVVKLDAYGNIAWQKVLGGNMSEEGFSIRQTLDGGYILTGWTESDNSGNVGANHGDLDVWIIKLDSSGNLQWQKVLGGNDSDVGYCIQPTADGGYVLAGSVFSSNNGDVGTNHGLDDFWVVKLLPENSAPLAQNIPSVGQAVSSYQVGFDGLAYNTDGRNTLGLDLQKARRSMATVAVYADRVEIYQRAPDGVLMTFKGNNFAIREDKITGPVTTADFVTDPIEAPLTPGIVSASVRATIPSLTQPGMLRTTISDRPDLSLVDQFRALMEQNGLEYDMVAYTYDVRKNTMPPAGNAVVILTLPEQWVNQHGGIGAVRIIRVSDTTGIAEMIPAVYNGTDQKGIMQFRGISINGTSVFGLVTLKASTIAKDNNQSLTSFPAQQPAITTILGLFGWLLGSIQQNPAGTIAIAATAGAAYAGRKRGMW